MEIGGFVERIKDGQQIFSGFGLDNNLPRKSGAIAFMEGWHRWRYDNLRERDLMDKLHNFFAQFLGIRYGATFGFVGE